MRNLFLEEDGGWRRSGIATGTTARTQQALGDAPSAGSGRDRVKAQHGSAGTTARGKVIADGPFGQHR
ncbi:hypothetical protein G6F23_016123 [Rhizopus arrhizus]|nr:hypothetical protein G6F23_016123 [Rhizopus arrhizus]